MPFRWPDGFRRVPDEDWTRAPPEQLARKYDNVANHGWYENLDPTVAELAGALREGDIMLDYSGGTGILIDRLLRAMGDRPFGVVNVDSSPKFLALCLRKLEHDERVAFRLIRWLREEKRLQLLDEILDPPLLARGVDGIVSANAIHLYHGLGDTLRSWHRVLRPGGWLHVQSGNIRNPDAAQGSWIIDDTVEAVHRAALEIVRGDARYKAYGQAAEDPARLARYDALRGRFFLAPRPLGFYLEGLREAGFEVRRVRAHAVRARVDEWREFLDVYHEGILGWVGGSEKAGDPAPSAEEVADRRALLRLAAERVFGGREEFDATWTYLTCRKPA